MNCTFQEDSLVEHNKSFGLQMGIWLTALYFVVELATGIFANSLAMVGDSFHMLVDVLVQILTYRSRNLRNLPPKNSAIGYLSFGFRRIETMVILFNVFLLIGVKIWILYEVYLRFFYGHNKIVTPVVFFVAVIGLAINFKVSRLWHVHEHDHTEDGIKSANLHIRDDLYGSVAVIVSTAGMFIASLVGYKIYWLDSLAAMFIFGLLWKTTYRITKSAVGILMEAVPIGIDFDRALILAKQVDGVEDVLDFHISKVGSGLVVLTGQVLVKSHDFHDSVPGLIENSLRAEFPELKNAHLTIETRCSSDPA